ncbi:uncharacterized protein LOC105683000 [Athalia rosae]|uniref:uncharacterized protein LOC105683000 n=1 Tax=Athalia rosae TaxID=37344 RepID=UPI002033DBF0|nr:uncharacterized protein LOC105683000 [Athalia rosae]
MFQTKAERNRKYRKRGGVKVRKRKQAAIARDLNQINELIELAYKTANLSESTTLSHNQIDSTCPFSPPTPQSSHSPGDSPSPTDTLSPVLLPQFSKHQHFTNHPTSHQGTSTSPASPEVIDLTTEPDTYSPGLPTIQPPKFNGELLEWQSFKNMFISVVNKEGVNEIDKMHYLLQSLPYSLVANVEIIDIAFATAWQTLTTSIPKMASRSAKEINYIMNTTSEVFNALNALGSPVNQWDHIIVHYITQKLDPLTREDWEITLGAATDFPTYERLKSFLLARARALEAMEGRLPVKPRDPKAKRNSSSGSKATYGSKLSSAHVHMASSSLQNTTTVTGQFATPQSPPGLIAGGPPRPQRSCSCCGEAHFIVSCPTFQNLSPNERQQQITSKSLCPNCLGPHSFENYCSIKRCRFCQAAHHFMLHNSTLLSSHTNINLIIAHRIIVLAIAYRCIATLVATRSLFVLHSLIIKTAGVVGYSMSSHRITNKSSSPRSVPSGSTKGAVDITLRSNHSDDQIDLHVHVNPGTTLQISPGRIDILIGADSYGSIIKPGVITGNPNQPIAIQTVFRWAVFGPAGPSSITAPAHQGHLISNLQLHELVSRFWEQEEVPASHQESLSAEEVECEAHFIATHSRDSCGRYIVRLPFKSNAPPLGYSKGIAQRSLSRLLHRIVHQPNLHRLYTEFLTEYESLGHMEKVQ